MPAFERYVGIDYPGAQTPTASLKELPVCLAEGNASPNGWLSDLRRPSRRLRRASAEKPRRGAILLRPVGRAVQRVSCAHSAR